MHGSRLLRLAAVAALVAVLAAVFALPDQARAQSPPTLVSATVDGDTLVMTFSADLNESSIPGNAKFVVKENGTENTVTNASISGRDVTLTLTTAVSTTATVTVGYTLAPSNPLEDTEGTDVAAFSDQAVENHSIAPTMIYASAQGTTLVVYFDEALNESVVPGPGKFKVAVNGNSEQNSTSLDVSGSTVTLTIPTEVESGGTVTLKLIVNSGQPKKLQDLNGNTVAGFAHTMVTNALDAPMLSTATVDGASLVLTYDETLATGSTPAASAYSVSVDGGMGTTPSSASVSGSAVTLTLATPVANGQTVTVSYAVGTSRVQDAQGNVAAPLTNQAVTNNTPAGPALSTATVNGTSMALTFDGALDTTMVPAASAFTVKVDGGAGTAPSTVSISGSVVTLTLATAVAHGQTVTVSYAPPTTGNKLQDGDSLATAAFTDRTVTNNTPDTTAPTLDSATVNGTSLVLTYNEPLDTSSAPVASAYSVSVDGGAGTAPSSVAIAGSAVTLTLATAVEIGQTVTVTYTVPTTGNKLQDDDSNAAGALSDYEVTNNTADTTAPMFVRGQINENTRDLVLTYDEPLDEGSVPNSGAFTVTVNTNSRNVTGVAISGSTVTLRLQRSAPAHGATVKVTYTVPETGNKLQDAAATPNAAAALTDQAVTVNDVPTSFDLVGVHQVGKQLMANTSRISDRDGLTTATFEYQWLVHGGANDGMEIAGATSSTYTPVASDVGEELKVRVSFTDDGGSSESVLSQRSQAILAAPGDCDPDAIWCATLTVGYADVAGGGPTGQDQARGYCDGVSGLNPCGYSGDNLTDDDFTLAGRNHTVRSIRWPSVTLIMGFEEDDGPRLHLTLNNDLVGSAIADLTFEIHTWTFSFMHVGRSLETGNLNNNYRWGHHGSHPNLTELQYAASGTEFLVQLHVPPKLSTATVDGDSLVLTYDKALDEGSVPLKGRFTVRAGGSNVTVSSVAISGKTVTLMLATEVEQGATVTVTYRVQSGNKVQDTGGRTAAALMNQAVTNDTGDTSAPTLSSATVDGTSLVLTYNEALDTGSVPAASEFTVKVGTDTTGVAPSTVAVSGSTVTLTLANRVTSGQAVTVSYAATSGNKVQNEADIPAEALTDETVTNNTAPVLSTATVNGATLVLTYDGALRTGTSYRPLPGAYSVTVGGTAVTVSTVAISGSTVTLTLSTAVTSGQAVTVSYTVPSSRSVQNPDGIEAAGLTNEAVTNNTPPALSTATVNGTKIVLTYDGALDTGSVPDEMDYLVTVGSDTPAEPSNVSVSGSAVELTLSTAVTSGDTVSVSYTATSGNKVQNPAGIEAAALTNQAVTNNTPPALSTATVNGVTLVLTYDDDLATGSVPAAGDYEVLVGGTEVTVSTVAISGKAVTLTLATAATYGETVTVTYDPPSTGKVQNSEGVAAAALSTQTVTNNTPGTVSFGAAAYSVDEGASVSVTVTTDRAPTTSTQFPLTLTRQGGASVDDYTAAAVVTIAAGQSSGALSFTATTDDIDDDGESVKISFTNLPTGYVRGATSETTVTITDGNASAIVIDDSDFTIDESDDVTTEDTEENQATFNVTLATKPSANVTITVTSEDTGAATVDTGNTDASKLYFTPMNWNVAQSVTVTAVQDPDHADETGADPDGMGLKVTLAAASTDSLYDPLEATVRVTVTDDDEPGLVLSRTSLAIIEALTDTFTVKLATKPAGTVTVTVTSDDATAVTVNKETLTFNTTTWNTPQEITVTAVDDADASSEVVEVELSASGSGYDGTTAAVTVTTTDTDSATLVVQAPSPFTVAEGGAGTFTVKLSNQPSADVTVTVESRDRAAATVEPVSLTFNSVNWNSPRMVTVRGVDDDIDEGAGEDVTIDLSASGGGYDVMAAVTLTISDNDTAGLVITPTPRNVTVTEGATAQFSVKLASEPTQPVTVTVTSPDTDHVTAPSTSLSFNDGNWETEQTVTLTGVHDADTMDETGIQVTVSVSSSDALYDPLETTVTVNLDDDDPDVTVRFGQASYSVAESDDSSTMDMTENEVTVTVKLNQAPNRTLVIPIETTAQGGISTTDYSAIPGNVTFTATDTEKEFTFTAAHDTVDDDGESVKLEFGATLPPGVTEGSPSETTVSITDDDDPELTVSFGAATYTATEGGTAATVTVTLSDPPEREVTIPVRVASLQNGDDYDSSATDPVTTTAGDYSGAPANVTFASTETSKTFTFTATDDDVDDDNEKVVLGFDVANLPDRITVGTQSTTTVTIEDNDDPPVVVNFAQAAYSIDEDDAGGTVTITLTLSDTPEREVTIPLVVTNQGGATTPGDYSGVPSQIVFGQNETSRSFTFTVVDDTVDDDGESVKLAFGMTLPARVTAGGTDETVVSIGDDDVPEVTVSFGAATYTVAESDDDTTTDMTENEVAITVSVSADPERTIIIPITATGVNGDDYDEDEANPEEATTADFSVPATVTFNAGDTGSKTITFTATHDTVDDDGEKVELTFDSGNLPEGVSVSGTSKATVSITDDDHPSVNVSYEQDEYTVGEGGTTTVKVTLDHVPEREVVIPLTRTPGGGATDQDDPDPDYSGIPATVTFASGETEKTFTLTAVDDSVDDDDESVTLGFGTVADSNVSASGTTTINIRDGDVPEVEVSFETATYTAAEGGSAVTIKVQLDVNPERTVTVTVGATGASSGDYTLSETSFTFTAGEQEKEFTFTATDDTYDDDGETVTLSFSTPLPTRVSTGTNGTATVSITDDDTLDWSVTANPATVAENGGTATFTFATTGVTFETAQTIALTLGGTATITDDYIIESGGSTLTSPFTLTLPADETSITATITSQDDVISDGDETVTLTAAYDGADIGAATATITDDETASDTVTLSLASDEVGESAGAKDLVVTATLNNAASPDDIVIALSFSDDTAVSTDYTGATVNLTIPAGATRAIADISLTPTADTLHEDDEMVTLTGTTTTAGLTIESVDVTITDDDPLDWSVTPARTTISEVDETATAEVDETVTTVTISTGGATFADDQTITLSFGSGSTATQGTDFTIADSDSEEVDLLPQDLTLEAGEHEIELTVTGEDDMHGDPNEVIELEITFDGSAVATGSIELNDDETPSTEVQLSVSPLEVAESAGATTLTVTGQLDGAPLPDDTVVTLSVTGDTATVDEDYTFSGADPLTLTIAAGASSATATLTLTPVSDGVDEDDETVTIGGTLEGTSVLTVEAATVTITDDDTRGIAVDPALLEITTNGTGTYSVVLESEPTEDVVVTIALPADPDHLGLNTDKQTLTFTDENWATEQEVTVQAAGDEGTVIITHSISGGDYADIEVPSVTVNVSERTSPPVITGLGGGGPSGPTPSEVEFEWTVKHDIEALAADQASPTGSWSDGATFFLLENGDGADDALYAYDIETGERREDLEFKLDERNRAPRGIWAGVTTLYIADSGQDKLFAYDAKTGERDPDSDIEMDERNRDARAIWSDGKTMWVLNANPSLFAYDLATGAVLGRFTLDGSNSDPSGIWSDGVSFWVSDPSSSPRRLFAYRVPTLPAEAEAEPEEPPALERVRDEEFEDLSSASNNSPRGIWSDGEVMYVADESDGRVYTYNMPDALNARLASLTLSDLDIGEFDGLRTEYVAALGEDVTSTTVRFERHHRGASVAIAPEPAGGDATLGYEVALTGLSEITFPVFQSAPNSALLMASSLATARRVMHRGSRGLASVGTTTPFRGARTSASLFRSDEGGGAVEPARPAKG